jgi:DNA-binding response OmpR family regulator
MSDTIFEDTRMQILLVEDDPVIGRELGLHWQQRGWHVFLRNTLAAASEAILSFRPDVIVLDLQLPDGDGLRWLETLRRRDRQLPVLVLTARDRVTDRVEGLKRGADDYLVKPFALEEVDARLEALKRRSELMDGERLQCGPLALFTAEGLAQVNGVALELLPREFEVLNLLAARSPRVVPKSAIVETLAERNLELGDTAAEVYVSRLRRKLSGMPLVIDTVRGFGYRLQVVEPGQAGSQEGP